MDKNLTNSQKIFKKINDSYAFYYGYHGQAFQAYAHYSNIFATIKSRFERDIERLVRTLTKNQRRSNVYYANIEVLKGLILPQIPSMILGLNPSKKTNQNLKETKNFYDVCTNILTILIKNATDNLPPSLWESFKLDYLITGRGVLWANMKAKTHDDSDDKNNSISVDHVRWQDFAMDTKPTWDSVGWVARRLLYTPKQFRKVFDVEEDKITDGQRLDAIYGNVTSFDSFGDTSSYIEVWDYWDRPSKTQYIVSRQYNSNDDDEEKRYVIEKNKFDDMCDDFFFPTTQPPLTIYNGVNLIPISDLWTYINELTELNNIVYKRSKLIESLHLRGYTDTARANVINAMETVTDQSGSQTVDDNVVAVPGFTPTANEPLIYYVDNNPRLELLKFLQDEYQFLIDRIYHLTGISEQMRNVTSNEDDETATSVRMKSKFGSRRLKEHQQKLLDYWVGILKNLLHRICQTITADDLKEIFDYNFPDTVKPEIQECVFQRAELIKQIQEIQGQLPDETGQGQQTAGLNAPPPVAPLGQGRPLQAQAAPNQNTMRGMPGARLPNATVIQTTPDENSGGTTDIYGQVGGPTQQMGVQQTQADAQQEDAQIAQGQQQGLPPQPLGAGQGQGDIQAQHDDLQQQLQDLDKRYEDLMTQVTWDKIVEFFRKDNLVSFLVTARLDDLENKIIADEKKNSDLEYMNSIMNLVNQIIANVNSNPKFTDIYSSIFSLSLDNFDQTKAQRDSIDEFIKEIKEVGKQMADNPPQQPPPSPDDQEKLAKAQLLQAQAREIEMKIQMQQMQMQQGMSPDGNNGNRLEEMQLQHQNDMQLQQAKITAEHEKYANKMKSDEQLLQMKIQADKERYEEKMKSDIVDKTNQQQQF